MYPMLTKLTYFGPELFPPTQDLKLYMDLHLNNTKWFVRKKSYFLSQDFQIRNL